MYTFAQLGSIRFELLPITGMEERYAYEYPEHQVIEGKPLLQYIGDRLDEHEITIRFHANFCDPQKEFDLLKQEADKHEALPYVLASGQVKGSFVICDIHKTIVKTFADGYPLLIEARLQLKEYYDPDKLQTLQAQQQKVAAGLKSNGPVAVAMPAPGNNAALIRGGITAGAAQIGEQARRITSLSDLMTGSVTAVGAQLRAAAERITGMLGPICRQAGTLAADAGGAAALIQADVTSISGISSDLARITSGIPGIGPRIAAANRVISGQATQMITLASLARGDAIEAGTRARMITRMLPQ